MRKSLLAFAAAGILAAGAFTATPAAADPPSWAPAHGWRAKQADNNNSINRPHAKQKKNKAKRGDAVVQARPNSHTHADRRSTRPDVVDSTRRRDDRRTVR
jgi:hypothetical protein